MSTNSSELPKNISPRAVALALCFTSPLISASAAFAQADPSDTEGSAADEVSLDKATAESGNPFVEGYYADPDIAFYEGEYWVFPTTSRTYEEQTFLDAFSSPDLVNWTKHSNVLTFDDISWGDYALWAPAPVERDGKYYLYFGANDIQTDDQLGGIGVAVADRPEGPYSDAIGEPLIGEYYNGAQPIDQDVWIDDDGQAYMYYGGQGRANVAKLNADMTSFGEFDDGTTFREITPEGYVEGSQMFKRDGQYYLMWSEGGWTGPDYSVAYAISDSPTGPFDRLERVLEQNDAVARGAGHNSVMNVPGTDEWYIFYHRRPLSETDANAREIAYDRMDFNPDGTIAPITMLVQDNFNDGNDIGWDAFGGTWSVSDGSYQAGRSFGGLSLLDDRHADFIYDATLTLTSNSGDAGVVFRVQQPSEGADAYEGYYAGIQPASGRVILGSANGGWNELDSAPLDVEQGAEHQLRVTATGSSIEVFVDDMDTPVIAIEDAQWTSGRSGVRVYDASATFDDIDIRRR